MSGTLSGFAAIATVIAVGGLTYAGFDSQNQQASLLELVPENAVIDPEHTRNGYLPSTCPFYPPNSSNYYPAFCQKYLSNGDLYRIYALADSSMQQRIGVDDLRNLRDRHILAIYKEGPDDLAGYGEWVAVDLPE